MPSTILISGGAGYIGSHAAYALQKAGYTPVVIDDLSTGNAWATEFGTFEKGDVGDTDFVRSVCEKFQPAAAMHFAAFIEVGESVQKPDTYFENNRDKASRFFETLNLCGINKIVFSSTAAVYGDAKSNTPLTETTPTLPINPYGQSKLDAEYHLRSLDVSGMRSVALRYFNVAGAAPAEAKIGEAHQPESHLIPRLLLPLLDTSQDIQDALGLKSGFTIYGNDFPTPDGTAIRDYVHVLDLIDAHKRALDYLLNGGATNIFNLGSGNGFSVHEIVEATKKELKRPDFKPSVVSRRAGDPAVLVASSDKAGKILNWKPQRGLSDIINSAAAWHRSERYKRSVQFKTRVT